MCCRRPSAGSPGNFPWRPYRLRRDRRRDGAAHAQGRATQGTVARSALDAKAYVIAISQSLQHELAAKGIRIQAVLPGATAIR